MRIAVASLTLVATFTKEKCILVIFGKFKKRNPCVVGFFRRILDRNVVVAEVELRHGTVSWDCLVDSFVLTFSINEVSPALDTVVRLIHTKLFDDQEIVEY